MLQARLKLSERRACRIVGQHRSTQRHSSLPGRGDDALRKRLHESAERESGGVSASLGGASPGGLVGQPQEGAGPMAGGGAESAGTHP